MLFAIQLFAEDFQLKTFEQYRKAAEQGDAIAQCKLGLFYEKGIGVAKTPDEAVKWFRKAAKQENA